MQDDSRQNCPMSALPVSLYNYMFGALRWLVKSLCEHEVDKN